VAMRTSGVGGRDGLMAAAPLVMLVFVVLWMAGGPREAATWVEGVLQSLVTWVSGLVG